MDSLIDKESGEIPDSLFFVWTSTYFLVYFYKIYMPK